MSLDTLSSKNRCLSVTAAYLAYELLSAGRMEILQLSYSNKFVKPKLLKVMWHYIRSRYFFLLLCLERLF